MTILHESVLCESDGPETNETHSGDIHHRLELCVGLQLDVLDCHDVWSEAEIVKIDFDAGKIYVTFTYWSDQYDEWINISDSATKLAPLHAHTYTDENGIEGRNLKIKQRIEVKDPYGKWLESFVIAENTTEVKVHYHGYHAKFDEWIPRESMRIRPFGRYKQNLATKRNVQMKKWNVPVVPKADNNGVVDNNLKQMVETHRNRKVTATSDHFQQYTEALSRMNLSIVSVDGDGNCLFRAVSHQVYGSDSYHGMVRSSCMDYMEANADFFSQFVVGGMDSFHLYVAAKRMNAVWGDDPEIHAMCEIYDLPAEIWAHDSRYGARKLLTFHEGSRERVRGARSAHPNTPMRLSYYGGGHYDSIVDNSYNNSFESYRGILNGVAPGVVERTSIERARKRLKASSAASVSESSSAFSTNAPLTNDRDAKFDNSGLQEEQAQLQRALTESRKNLIHNLCYEQDVQANTSNGTDDFVSGDVEQSMLWNIIQQEKVVEAKECANAKGSFSAETDAKSDDCKGSVNEIQNFTAVTDAKELKEIEIKETNDVLLQSAVLESENEEVNRAIQASLKDTGKNPILCYNEDEDLRMATQLSYNSKEFEDNQLRRAIEASVMDSKTEIAPFVAPSNDYALDDMLHFDDDPDLELERAIAESLKYSKK